MSLWRVPDEQTKDLMIDFHEMIWAGTPRAEALQKAQRRIMEKHSHPYYWGAFICQGDPGPLSSRDDPRAGAESSLLGA
jgi:CHAT domain-containing protein